MAEMEVSLSKKSDKDKADASKIGKGTKPTTANVEAQSRHWRNVICWNCWAVNEVIVDTHRWLYYYCWNCGALFEV